MSLLLIDLGSSIKVIKNFMKGCPEKRLEEKEKKSEEKGENLQKKKKKRENNDEKIKS